MPVDQLTFPVSSAAVGSLTAELPRVTVETALDPAYSRAADIVVNAGDNLQAALDTGQPGQIVELEAGATWVGNFVLRNKVGDGWIYIRSSRYQELPPPGTRIDPALHAALMPKIETQTINVQALRTEKGTHHVRFIGIEFSSNSNSNAHVISLGLGYPNHAQSVNELPHHIIFDRAYVHGPPVDKSGVGIEANGRHIGIIDSCISDIHHTGRELQAVLAFNTDGPILIQNSYLQAAGENVMFGGSDPKILNLVPSDITIRGNYFHVPDEWEQNIPADYVVKNLFELKNARRVLIEGNVFEHIYRDAQRGVAIQLTPRNQNGGAPWSTVEDVTFRKNIVRDVKHFLNILGKDGVNPSQNARRILIEDNLVYGLNRSDSAAIDISAGAGPSYDLSIRHNTILHGAGGRRFLFIGNRKPSVIGFDFTDNIVTHGQYGVHFNSGTLADGWAVDYEFQNNVVSGGKRNVPAGNFVNINFNSIGFVDASSNDYELSASSPYKNAATDGKDIGADIDAVLQSTAGAVIGIS